MSTQDKMERILKQIHVALAEGEKIPGESDKVIVDRNQVFSILEQLNLAMNEMMDEYEMTSQARELAQRRSEKKGEEMLARVTRQADDVYAASLIYTDEALAGIQRLMNDALASSRRIWAQVTEDIEKEQRRVREDQMELREQLQDFKDSDKYITMLEECNREREKQEKEKEAGGQGKKIQNEAKHYAMKAKPEIKVNTSYFERRRQAAEQAEAEKHGAAGGGAAPGTGDADTEAFSEKPMEAPEIRVNTESEYFKQKEAQEAPLDTDDEGAWAEDDRENHDERSNGQEKKGIFIKRDWHLPFGKR